MVTQTTDASDEALARRAGAKDSDAFDELVLRFQHRVYRLAYRLVGNDQDALDVTQDVFLQLLRRLHTFRGESRFGTWVYRIATNTALMHLRARSRRPTESLEQYLPRFDSHGSHCGTPEELQVPERAEELLDRELLGQRMMRAIEQLPDSYRVAFVLRDLEELPTEEVAAALNLKPATVRQRVHRARLMLRGRLSDLVGVKR